MQSKKGEAMKCVNKKALRALALVLGISVSAATAFAGVTKKPYLIYEGNNTAMTVLWQDSASEATNTLSWGTDTSYGLGSATVPEYGTSFQHKYQITGLQPGTKYYYQVANGATVYGTGSFVAGPADDAKSVKFLAFGDTRSGPLAMEGVIQEMRKAYAADPAFQSLNLQAGDWVASDAETNWTNEWFNANPQTQLLLAEQPVSGVRGNHEANSKYFYKYYPYPYPFINTTGASNQNLYFSFDYGPVHFTVVDQYTTPYGVGSAQYNWVVSDLAGTTKPWKILVYHEPAWTAGTHTNNVTTQQVFDPLVKQYGIDLVYAGHNHNYARCQADSDAEANGDTIATKVPYITNGGGGAGLYAVDTSNTGAYKHVAKAISQYEYMTFDINDRILTANVYTVTRADGTNLSASVINPDTKSTLYETVTLVHARPDNVAPTVALTAPAANASFDALATVAIAADASDDVAVAKVEFYNGASKIGQSTSAPYQFTWSGVQTGTYTITAVATDNENARTTSAPVVVSVTNLDNVAPSVTLTSPANGASAFAGSSLTLSASASDSDGSVAKVAFYTGATKLAEVSAAPFTYTWTSIPVGSYAITAVATDNDGASSISPIANLSVVPVPAGGAISYSQNFDAMGTSGTTAPAGWSVKNGNSGTANNTWVSSIPANGANSVASMVNAAGSLTASNAPTATNNNGYNAGAPGNAANRMLATSPTSVAGAALQLQLANNSAGYITRLKVGYDIQRFTAPATANELPGYWLFYSLDNGSTWTNVAGLNPTLAGPGGVVVPNTVGVTSVPPTSISLSAPWNPNSNLLLRWVDDNAVATSPDQIHGLDNVTVATLTPLQVGLTSSGFLMNRTTRLYNGTLTVTNTGPTAISGALSVTLNNLSSGVTLVNPSGTDNGFPYLVQNLAQPLIPGASLSIPLSFNNPAGAKINFVPAAFQE
jgi:hypothetical protein